MRSPLLLALALVACSAPVDPDEPAPDDCDADGDGWAAVECGGGDCCDVDASTYPGGPWATEPDACGSWDRDCSGEVELGGGLSTCAPGQLASTADACYAPEGHALGQGVANGGWIGAVPDCGEPGELSGECVFHGGAEGCVEDTPAPGAAVQACR